jgi:hypothetical protein
VSSGSLKIVLDIRFTIAYRIGVGRNDEETAEMKLTNADIATIAIGTQIRSTQIIRLGMGTTETQVTLFTVTGRRKAPKGMRLYLQSEFGWGCAVTGFDHPNVAYEVI